MGLSTQTSKSSTLSVKSFIPVCNLLISSVTSISVADVVPNLDIIIEYLDKLSIAQLLELNDIAKVLDWQLIGRTIGVVGETYKDKEV